MAVGLKNNSNSFFPQRRFVCPTGLPIKKVKAIFPKGANRILQRAL
jgi:hypothetical protein